MEYLASRAYHFSVWSSDPLLQKCTNLTIRAHAKCSVLRLTQYVHYLLCQQVEGFESKVKASELTLQYKFGMISKEQRCQDIEPNYTGVVRLRLERQQAAIDVSSDSMTEIEYDPETFFNTDVQVHCNTLTVKKVFKGRLEKVSLQTSLIHLAKLAVEQLNNYEQDENVNICRVHQHTLEDVLAVDIAGRSHAVALSQTTEDLTLSDLLGIDFVPAVDAYCCLLCKVKHLLIDDGITIEFVSEAKLTIKKMVVNTNTTVLDVKNFICSVYAHALRLQPNDIKLIYKGCILHEVNGASNEPNRILKLVTEGSGAKLHVHITHEYSEPGPGFWNELLFAADRFEFQPTTSSSDDAGNAAASLRQNETAHTIDETTRILNSSNGVAHNSGMRSGSDHEVGIMGGSSAVQPTRTVSLNSSATDNTPSVGGSSDPQIPVFTSEGIPVTRSYETYERITIDSHDFFVPRSRLEPETFEIEVEGQTVTVSREDIEITGDEVRLSRNAKVALENAIGEPIRRNVPAVPAAEILEEVAIEQDNQNQRPNPNRSWLVNVRRIFSRQTVTRIIQTVTGRLGLILFLAFELYPILPLWIFYSLVGSLVLQSVWVKFDVGRWIRKLAFGSFDRLTPEEINQISVLVDNEKLDETFFAPLAETPIVFNALTSRITENEPLRAVLLDRVSQWPRAQAHLLQNQDLEHRPKFLLKQFLAMHKQLAAPVSKRDKDIYYMLFHDLLRQTRDALTQELQAMDPLAHQLVSGVRRWNLNHNRHVTASYFQFFKLWIDVYRPWNAFTDCTLMRHVVPNPARDSLVLGLLKNCVLFVLLFLPNFERQFEDIIEQRLIQQSQEEEDRALA